MNHKVPLGDSRPELSRRGALGVWEAKSLNIRNGKLSNKFRTEENSMEKFTNQKSFHRDTQRMNNTKAREQILQLKIDAVK